MLANTHYSEDSQPQHILNVAPGEGTKPLSIFRDQYSEELAYPDIFLGQGRPENKDRLANVHYSDICKSGKAAYGIKGNTIHSTLAIPASQSLKIYRPLDSSRLNTLRCKLRAVKLIFLDEISMVGNTMFNVQINNRLKDIMGS